ncbi:sigma-70 family RNA polymerase sigma factor [Aureisphaera galaxeae]|uniref:RNA polymerase sigma factor n=1 Tax=Aureisphaera galaxeae TaxID=1538023 RepID=UPI0023509C32|nr:sigma-70 family RNA polymerase sigma factor [Aureisphaera galaxeae]MDC8002458.1 sigma-70 family RNA polymerase sigma factor [Aureisphaera galaxeae]
MHKEDPFIKGFLGGEPDILRKIYSQSFPTVRGYIMSRNGSKAEAEDIFHNALVTLYVKLKNDELQIQSFESYLFTMCRNMWRRERSKNRVTNLDTIPLVDESVDMAKFSIEQSQWDLYQEKFKELSENCRKLLGMTFKKIAYKEIVTFFNYASETVARQRVFKCKSRLLQLIKRDPRYLRLKT